MKKLMVYLDEDVHEDLKVLSLRKRASMAALVRYALDKTFEDDLDLIAAERALDEVARDPGSTISLEEYMEKRGFALPRRTKQTRRARSRRVAI